MFSIGFGPVLWSRRDRRGTLWQIAALPLGGYVKYLGDADGASRTDAKALERLRPEERRHSFHGASVGRRMLAVLAGPFFNFLLTIVVFAGLAMWQGVPTGRPTIGSIEALPSVEQPLHFALKTFRQRYPNIKLQIIEGLFPDVESTPKALWIFTWAQHPEPCQHPA